jgi:hypothetical protein
MNTPIESYVSEHLERGEWPPDSPFEIVDMIFFRASIKGAADAVDFERLTREHAARDCNPLDPFDGEEHGYMELSYWIGDRELALEYMALGTLLGLFELLTPRALSVPVDQTVASWAEAGFITVKRKAAAA